MLNIAFGKLYIEDKSIIIRPSVILFIVFLIDMYLEVPLIISSTIIIPGIIMLVATPLVAFIVIKHLARTDITLLTQISLITLASIVFTSRIGLIGSLLIKIVQFFVSISVGIILFELMDKIPAKRQRKIYFILSVTLLVGCFLEVHIGFIKAISDGFRSIYEGTAYNPYESANRDFEMIGFERPKFFTSEPSLAALGYMIFSTSYLLLSTTSPRFMLLLIMNLLFVVSSGSPINFLNLVIWGVLYVYQFRITLRTLLIGVASICLLLIVVWQSGTFSQILESVLTRLIEETFMPSSSLYSRLYIPYVEALPAALHYNLAFGVGYAGKDLLSSFDFANSSLKLESETGANAFARFFMFFGLLGGGLMVRCFYLYCRKKQITEIGLLFFLWCIYNQAIGSMESPRYWAYTFLLIGVFRTRSIGRLEAIQSIS